MSDQKTGHVFKPIRECCPDQQALGHELANAIADLIIAHGEANPQRSTCAVVSALTNVMNDMFRGSQFAEESDPTGMERQAWLNAQMLRVVQAIEANMPGIVKAATVQMVMYEIQGKRDSRTSTAAGDADLLDAWSPTGKAN